MVSSSRVWVWIGGASPARTRPSTKAPSPPDSSPARLRTGQNGVAQGHVTFPFDTEVVQADGVPFTAVAAASAGRGQPAIASGLRGYRQVRRVQQPPRGS